MRKVKKITYRLYLSVLSNTIRDRTTKILNRDKEDGAGPV